MTKTDKLRAAVVEAIKEAIPQALEGMDGIIDDFLHEYLEQGDAWVQSFGPDYVEVLVGIGPGDCALSFKAGLIDSLNPYGHMDGPRSDAQRDDIMERLEALESAIENLEKAADILRDQVKNYEGKRT